MTSSWVAATSATLIQASLLLLAVGAAAALLLGIGLLVMPGRTSAVLERSYQFPTGLDRTVFWERFFYRHHWSLGGLIIVGAAYIIAMLLTFDDPPRIAAAFGVSGAGELAIILIESLRAVLLLCSVLALPFGAVIFIRPSLLKAVERVANRWIKTPTPRVTAAAPLAHPRWWGLFFVAGALYTLAGLGLAFVAH